MNIGFISCSLLGGLFLLLWLLFTLLGDRAAMVDVSLTLLTTAVATVLGRWSLLVSIAMMLFLSGG